MKTYWQRPEEKVVPWTARNLLGAVLAHVAHAVAGVALRLLEPK